MEKIDLLKKLASEVEKDGTTNLRIEGDKSGIGIEKTSDDKKPSFKSEKEKDKNGDTKDQGGSKKEKSDGKAPPFGKKSEEEKGKIPEDGNNGKEKDNTNNGKNIANGDKSEKGNEYTGGNKEEIAGNKSEQNSAGLGVSSAATSVIDFLEQNPTPDGQSFHAFTESQGMDANQAESIAYALAGKYVMFLRGGKSVQSNIDLTAVDPDQLNKGIEVESEHTSDPTTAKKIALDHLAEIPDYYTRLDEMENPSKNIVAEPKEKSNNFEKKDEKEKVKKEDKNTDNK